MPNNLKKKLRQIDAAFALARHITPASLAAFIASVTEAVQLCPGGERCPQKDEEMRHGRHEGPVCDRAATGPAAQAAAAVDQSTRYADLAEEDLVKNGKHVLVAFFMSPQAGCGYLGTAAHFAAESSTGTNVTECTSDDPARVADALVYHIGPDNEEVKIAYPCLRFEQNITDGRALKRSLSMLTIGSNRGLGGCCGRAGC